MMPFYPDERLQECPCWLVSGDQQHLIFSGSGES